MIRKICPICDQTMKSAHYCRNCRTWVRSPIVREVDYYLNESHPSWETGCSYHTEPTQAAQPQSGWVRGGAPSETARPAGAGSDRPAAGTGTKRPVSAYPPMLPNQRRPASKKPAGGALLGWGLVFVIVVFLLQTCARMGRGLFDWAENWIPGNQASEKFIDSYDWAFNPDNWRFDGWFQGTQTSEASDTDLGSFVEQLDDMAEEYQELTDEEVRAAGVVCNSADHLPVSGEALVDELVRLLEQQGVEICGTNTYSFNEVYDDGTTWYDTWTSIDLQDGAQGTYQYAEVDYDTATGELHQVSLSLEDGTVLADTAVQVLAFIEEQGGPAGLIQYGSQIREELAAAMQQETGYQWECDGLYLEGVSYDTNYNVVVVPTGE